MICINTSRASESHKTVITYKKADPPSQNQPGDAGILQTGFLPRPEKKGKSKRKNKKIKRKEAGTLKKKKKAFERIRLTAND